MKKTIGIVGLIVLLSLVFFGSLSFANKKNQNYKNERLGFSATFPYPTKEAVNDFGDVMIAATNKENTISYIVSIFNVNQEEIEYKTPDDILDDEVQNAVDRADGVLSGKKTVSIKSCSYSNCNKYDGREFIVNAGTLIARCRLYLVNNKLYFPMIVYDKGSVLPISVMDFHNAFNLL